MKPKILSSLCLSFALTLCLSAGAQNQKRVPGVDDLLNIRQVGGVQISPDGSRVAYTVSEADFKQDAFVSKGYGHGITKPKSMRVVMQHNLGWFNHYIFGDPLPDFATPDIPGKEGK